MAAVLHRLDFVQEHSKNVVRFKDVRDRSKEISTVYSAFSSPSLKRKTAKRSKSAPPGSKVSCKTKETGTRGAAKKYIFWNVDFTPPSQTTTKKGRLLTGSDFKIANAGIDKGIFLESIIVEACVKSQRQAKFMRIFTETGLSQSGYWRKLKWYNDDGHIYSMVHIVRQWVKSESKTLWCKSHGINMAFMTFLWGQCKCIYATLLTSLKHQRKLPLDLESLSFSEMAEKAVDDVLKDILIEVYGTKVCRFRGIKSAGYFCFSKKCTFDLEIRPAVNVLASLPEYIVPLVITKSGLIKLFIQIPQSTAKELIAMSGSEEDTGRKTKRLEPVVLEVADHEFQTRLMDNIRTSISDINFQGYDVENDMYFKRKDSALHVFVPKTLTESVKILADKCITDIRGKLRQESISVIKSRPLPKGNSQDVILNLSPGLVCKKVTNQQETVALELNPFYQDLECSGSLKPMIDYKDFLSVRPLVYSRRYMKGFVCCTPEQADGLTDNYKLLMNMCSSPPSLKDLVQKEKQAIVFRPPVFCKLEVTHDPTDASLLKEIQNLLVGCFGKDYHHKLMFHVKENLGNNTLEIMFVFKGKGACDRIKKLSSKSLCGMKIVFINKEDISQQLSTIVLVVESSIFDAVNSAITKATVNMCQIKSAVKHIGTSGVTEVKFITDCPKAADSLKSILERCVTFTSYHTHSLAKRKMEFLESPDGRIYINHVMAKTATVIIFDDRIQMLKVYGTLYGRNKACDVLDNLDPNSRWVRCSLALKAFTKDIISKIDDKGRITTDLDALKEVVYDCNNFELICHLSGTPNELDRALGSLPLIEGPDGTTQCVTCYTSVAVDRSYRLQGCGHDCCDLCLCEQMNVAVKNNQFPIQCARCGLELSLLDFLNIDGLNGQIRLEDIQTASMRQCINTCPEGYLICPSITCGSLMMITPEDFWREGERSVMQCKYCKLALCLSCRSHDHPGMTCEENMQDIVTWMKEDSKNRRRCPSCTMGIQKTGGCQNIWCTSCKKAVCWKCNEYFDSEDLCYRHLRSEHGGYN